MYFIISLALCLPLGYFLIDRISFVQVAQRTSGVVEDVWGHNGSCGRKRSRHDCTRYDARLRYQTSAGQYRIVVSAGSARGHNQPVSRARYAVGAREIVAYDPRNPARAYRNKLWDIWGTPLVTFFVQICTFLASFSERKKERRY